MIALSRWKTSLMRNAEDLASRGRIDRIVDDSNAYARTPGTIAACLASSILGPAAASITSASPVKS